MNESEDLTGDRAKGKAKEGLPTTDYNWRDERSTCTDRPAKISTATATGRCRRAEGLFISRDRKKPGVYGARTRNLRRDRAAL